MRPARSMALAAIALAAVLTAGCSSGGQATSVTSASVSPSATPTPSPTPSPSPSTTLAGPPTSTTPRTTTTKPTTSKPPAVLDPLTGGKVSPGPVLAVKIDNTSAGLPQFGVSEADVVYIEQVEGGLTRMIAVFHSVLPAEVGPVRSVRSTDVELLRQYGSPGLVFSGGADGPLTLLHASKIVDGSTLDGAYWRSDAAPEPYNLHANLQVVGDTLEGVGNAKPIGFTFMANDPRVAKGKPAGTIDVVMQSGETRFRFGGGKYQIVKYDEDYKDAGGTLVKADNVLVQNVVDELDGTVNSVGAPSYLSHTIGTGTFTLYRDGRALTGEWSRADGDSPTKFLDGSGKPVPFKPGKTWVLLAPQKSVVTVS